MHWVAFFSGGWAVVVSLALGRHVRFSLLALICGLGGGLIAVSLTNAPPLDTALPWYQCAAIGIFSSALAVLGLRLLRSRDLKVPSHIPIVISALLAGCLALMVACVLLTGSPIMQGIALLAALIGLGACTIYVSKRDGDFRD